MSLVQNYHIRPATIRDAEGIWEVHTRSIRELCRKDYTPEQIEAWAGPRRPTDYLGRIQAGSLFVAEASGRIVGFGEHREDRGEICAVYVHPDHGRQGIGRALFTRVVDELRTKGFDQAWLDASLTSVGFYLTLGCRKMETKEHRFGTGASIPCVRMQIDL